MKFKRFSVLIITLLISAISFTAQAQCAMCKGSVQTSSYAKSINHGIEYLLLAPIILVSAILIMWWKNKDKFVSKEN